MNDEKEGANPVCPNCELSHAGGDVCLCTKPEKWEETMEELCNRGKI